MSVLLHIIIEVPLNLEFMTIVYIEQKSNIIYRIIYHYRHDKTVAI